MKINNKYELKKVLDNYVLIDNSKNSNYIMKINEVSKRIFECINEKKNKEEIVEILLNEDDVNKEQLLKDIDDFINESISKGIIIND